jgi:hypothetical protein
VWVCERVGDCVGGRAGEWAGWWVCAGGRVGGWEGMCGVGGWMGGQVGEMVGEWMGVFGGWVSGRAGGSMRGCVCVGEGEG